MKKALIIIGFVGIIGIGVGFYFYKNKNKLTDKDFDLLVNLSKNKGQDIFDGLSDIQLLTLKNNYLKYFNIDSHNKMIDILGKGEKNLTESDKKTLQNYLKKINSGLKS